MARVTVAHAPAAVLPDIGMSQSSILVGALLAAFILYLAINKRLGVYWSLLTGGTGQQAAANAAAVAAAASNNPVVTSPSGGPAMQPTGGPFVQQPLIKN
jgi:hypothetical protein